MAAYGVRVSPGELRFSAAHFITFDGTCENLHGHNFHVRIDARGRNGGDAFVIDFVLLTRLAAGICATLHDRVLLPGHSEEIRVRERDDQIEATSYDKRYSFSRASCVVLPLVNTTAEMLARHIGDRLLDALRAHDALATLESVEVAVEEADDQWGICRFEVAHG